MRALKEQIALKLELEEVTGYELYKIIKDPTDEIQEIVDEFITNLHIGFANYINIFEPEAICIGGSFAYYEDLLLEPIIKKMRTEIITFNKSIPKIVVAEMGNDAGLIGATIIDS